MPRLAYLVTASGLLGLAAAQSSSSVTSIFFPFADQQPLVASVIAQSSDIKTLAIQCAPDTPSDDCGFPTPITITAGPSTLHYNPSGIYNMLGELDCKITGTTEAVCDLTTGLYDTASLASVTTDLDYASLSASGSETTTATAIGMDVSFLAVTITAGPEATGRSASASGSSSGSGSASPSTESGSSSRTSTSGTSSGSSSSASASSTASANGAGIGFGISGAMAAAGLVALPMFIL